MKKIILGIMLLLLTSFAQAEIIVEDGIYGEALVVITFNTDTGEYEVLQNVESYMFIDKIKVNTFAGEEANNIALKKLKIKLLEK